MKYDSREAVKPWLAPLLSSSVPCRVYTDLHTMFISPDHDKLTVEQELAGKTVRVFDTLGIQHIGAHSPQAKSRVERLWGTFQQRLFIELRLAGIRSLEEANAFLLGFIARYNARRRGRVQAGDWRDDGTVGPER